MTGRGISRRARCQKSGVRYQVAQIHLTPGDGFEQLISRVITNSGTNNGTVYTVHDVFGNVIAELDGTGASFVWRFRLSFVEPAGSAFARIHLASRGRDRADAGVAHERRQAARGCVGREYGFPGAAHGARRSDQSACEDDEFGGRGGLGRGLQSVWQRVFDHRCGNQQRALPRPVVPVRGGLALQLAPALRSDSRPLHPARSLGLRRWAECVCVCGEPSHGINRQSRPRESRPAPNIHAPSTGTPGSSLHDRMVCQSNEL